MSNFEFLTVLLAIIIGIGISHLLLLVFMATFLWCLLAALLYPTTISPDYDLKTPYLHLMAACLVGGIAGIRIKNERFLLGLAVYWGGALLWAQLLAFPVLRSRPVPLRLLRATREAFLHACLRFARAAVCRSRAR